MDDSTPFDLNAAIQTWRGKLESSPALSVGNLDELESHLRDATATLAAMGLSTEEAFLIACRRMGTGAALEWEYGKVNRERVWLDRALWGIIGCVLVVALSSFVSGLTTCVTMLGAALALPGNALGALYGFVHLAALAGATLGLWRVCRKTVTSLSEWRFG